MEIAWRKARFCEIESLIPENPGNYEIHTDSGVPLKTGIADNLKKRLLQHRASRQSCLKLIDGGDYSNPDDVRSKGSILAKHLYFDASITGEYDLTSEAERRQFLDTNCHILFSTTMTKGDARELEKQREQSGCFRYVGKVSKRKDRGRE